jgi:hypothetical protein
MRFRSRRTLVVAVAAGFAIALVAGGATALAESGSSSSDSARPVFRMGFALFGSDAVAVPVGSVEACGPLPHKPDGGPLAAAAAYLGLSEEELRTSLEGGKSLADVATAQGKSVDGLKQAMLAAVKADLDEQVAHGDITAEQEQTILTKLPAGIDDFVNGKGGLSIKIEVKGGKIEAKGGPGAVLGDPLETAAEYLGLSASELKQELRSGKSLAEIAVAQGKSVSGLKQKLIDAATADLEKAVDELVSQKGLAEPPCGEKVAALSVPDVH